MLTYIYTRIHFAFHKNANYVHTFMFLHTVFKEKAKLFSFVLLYCSVKIIYRAYSIKRSETIIITSIHVFF